MNHRAWMNSLLDERHQAFVITFADLPDPDSSKSLGLEHFHSNGHQHFAGIALSSNWTDRIFAVRNGKVRLVNFDLTMQQISAGSDHGSPQAMQHGPGCLVASKAKNTLETQGADTVLLVGDIPNSCEPNAQFGSGFVEYGAGRHGCLRIAVRTYYAPAGRVAWLAGGSAFWAHKSVWPTKFVQILPASILRMKPVQKLHPVLWVVLSSLGHRVFRIHPAILAELELKGYPVRLTSINLKTAVEGHKIAQVVAPY